MGKNELKTSIDKIRNTLAFASNAFNYNLYGYSDDPEDEDYSLRECSDHIERAFITALPACGIRLGLINRG